ncbi:response regulator [Bacillus sp. B15-48]|uniref:response regulator transcription factor n=1 Tax=Bacillus sp. B15-48 TaxID=1548601 RepID=UPI00193F741C|nr:response regulator [Bacillus sp. B15-48]
MRILIVEDEVRISQLLSMYLKRESFLVDVVDNGNDGLSKALQEDYQLIILDLFLPGKNGFEVLATLRQEKNTPVILLSAQSEANDQKRMFELGANMYISKPFSPNDVISKVKQLCCFN